MGGAAVNTTNDGKREDMDKLKHLLKTQKQASGDPLLHTCISFVMYPLFFRCLPVV